MSRRRSDQFNQYSRPATNYEGTPRTPDDQRLVGMGQRKSSSTSKLLFKNNSPSLADALDDMDNISKLTHKISEVQRRAADRFSQWAHAGENSAIDDVAKRMKELLHLYTEQQTKLGDAISSGVKHLRKMSDAEKDVKDAEKKVAILVEKENKLLKEMKNLQSPSLFKKPDESAVRRNLREILNAAQEREKAEQQLADTRAECEVIKMYIFRYGMKGLAEAHLEFSERTADIFSCHRELTELVPAVALEDVRHMRYEGAKVSRQRVEQVRRSLEPRPAPSTPTSQLVGPSERRRRSEPLRMGSRYEVRKGTPPPPYTPGAPPPAFTSR